MADIWFISDTHFGHENILTFKRDDGTPLRPFATMDEMHETIFGNIARAVKPQDKLYHLGDFGMGRWGNRMLTEFRKLPGHKRIVLGNHDKYKPAEYAAVFEQMHGVKRLEDFWLSHCPVHWNAVKDRKITANIHGHMHYQSLSEPKYFNACVERIHYQPIHIDQIRGILDAEQAQRNRTYETAAKELFPDTSAGRRDDYDTSYP